MDSQSAEVKTEIQQEADGSDIKQEVKVEDDGVKTEAKQEGESQDNGASGAETTIPVKTEDGDSAVDTLPSQSTEGPKPRVKKGEACGDGSLENLRVQSEVLGKPFL